MLAEVHGARAVLNPFGRIVEVCWYDLKNHYPYVELDAFIVMPNHVHGIVWLQRDVGAGLRPAPTCERNPTSEPAPIRRFGSFADGLPEIVRAFKSFSGRRINEMRGTSGVAVWQRNYYERVIRDERELNAARQYINDNPAKWGEDPNHPSSPVGHRASS